MFRKLQRLSRGRVALRKGDIPKVRSGTKSSLASFFLFITEKLTGTTTFFLIFCAACARIRDAGVFACLFDRL